MIFVTSNSKSKVYKIMLSDVAPCVNSANESVNLNHTMTM